MTAAALRSPNGASTRGTSWTAYKGWIVGFVIVLVVLAIGTGLWLAHHP